MNTQTFEKHKEDNPHLNFFLKESKLIPIEKSYSESFGIYNIVKRDFYIKSNGKGCYVDTFIKTVKVPREELKPSSNGFSFVVKNKYISKYTQ